MKGTRRASHRAESRHAPSFKGTAALLALGLVVLGLRRY